MQSARLNDALVWEEGKGRLYTFVDKLLMLPGDEGDDDVFLGHP